MVANPLFVIQKVGNSLFAIQSFWSRIHFSQFKIAWSRIHFSQFTWDLFLTSELLFSAEFFDKGLRDTPIWHTTQYIKSWSVDFFLIITKFFQKKLSFFQETKISNFFFETFRKTFFKIITKVFQKSSIYDFPKKWHCMCPLFWKIWSTESVMTRLRCNSQVNQ